MSHLWHQARAKAKRATPTARPMTARVVGDESLRAMKDTTCRRCGFYVCAPTCGQEAAANAAADEERGFARTGAFYPTLHVALQQAEAFRRWTEGL